MKNNSSKKKKYKNLSNKKKSKGSVILMWWKHNSGKLILNTVIRKINIILTLIISSSFLLSWSNVNKFILIHKSLDSIKWESLKLSLISSLFTIKTKKKNFLIMLSLLVVYRKFLDSNKDSKEILEDSVQFKFQLISKLVKEEKNLLSWQCKILAELKKSSFKKCHSKDQTTFKQEN